MVQQQHGHRLADDVAAADDDAALALNRDAGRVDEVDAARRGAGQEVEVADHDLADIDGVEGVDILSRVDRGDDVLLADLGRKRELD